MLRYINRKKRGRELTVYIEELGDALPSYGGVESAAESGELRELLNTFLRSQKKLNRDLFICRYYYLDSIGDIAARFGMTENQVKLRLFRIRGKLKAFLEKEGAL